MASLRYNVLRSSMYFNWSEHPLDTSLTPTLSYNTEQRIHQCHQQWWHMAVCDMTEEHHGSYQLGLDAYVLIPGPTVQSNTNSVQTGQFNWYWDEKDIWNTGWPQNMVPIQVNITSLFLDQITYSSENICFTWCLITVESSRWKSLISLSWLMFQNMLQMSPSVLQTHMNLTSKTLYYWP